MSPTPRCVGTPLTSYIPINGPIAMGSSTERVPSDDSSADASAGQEISDRRALLRVDLDNPSELGSALGLFVSAVSDGHMEHPPEDADSDEDVSSYRGKFLKWVQEPDSPHLPSNSSSSFCMRQSIVATQDATTNAFPQAGLSSCGMATSGTVEQNVRMSGHQTSVCDEDAPPTAGSVESLMFQECSHGIVFAHFGEVDTPVSELCLASVAVGNDDNASGLPCVPAVAQGRVLVSSELGNLKCLSGVAEAQGKDVARSVEVEGNANVVSTSGLGSVSLSCGRESSCMMSPDQGSVGSHVQTSDLHAERCSEDIPSNGSTVVVSDKGELGTPNADKHTIPMCHADVDPGPRASSASTVSATMSLPATLATHGNPFIHGKVSGRFNRRFPDNLEGPIDLSDTESEQSVAGVHARTPFLAALDKGLGAKMVIASQSTGDPFSVRHGFRSTGQVSSSVEGLQPAGEGDRESGEDVKNSLLESSSCVEQQGQRVSDQGTEAHGSPRGGGDGTDHVNIGFLGPDQNADSPSVPAQRSGVFSPGGDAPLNAPTVAGTASLTQPWRPTLHWGSGGVAGQNNLRVEELGTRGSADGFVQGGHGIEVSGLSGSISTPSRALDHAQVVPLSTSYLGYVCYLLTRQRGDGSGQCQSTQRICFSSGGGFFLFESGFTGAKPFNGDVCCSTFSRLACLFSRELECLMQQFFAGHPEGPLSNHTAFQQDAGANRESSGLGPNPPSLASPDGTGLSTGVGDSKTDLGPIPSSLDCSDRVGSNSGEGTLGLNAQEHQAKSNCLTENAVVRADAGPMPEVRSKPLRLHPCARQQLQSRGMLRLCFAHYLQGCSRKSCKYSHEELLPEQLAFLRQNLSFQGAISTSPAVLPTDGIGDSEASLSVPSANEPTNVELDGWEGLLRTQKESLGSRIWDALLANEEWRDEAPKLSGMLLELPPSELMEVLGSEEQFAGRVNEALSVLQQSRDSGAGAVSCAEPGGATTSPGPTGDDQGPALGLRSVCWWWVRRGSCQKGDACSKVHDDDLRTQFRSLAKNVCFHYKVLGTCNRGSRCRFSHCDTAAPVNSELSQSAVPNPSLSHDSSQPNQTSPVEHKSSLPSSTFLHSGNLSASSAGQLVSESDRNLYKVDSAWGPLWWAVVRGLYR